MSFGDECKEVIIRKIRLAIERDEDYLLLKWRNGFEVGIEFFVDVYRITLEPNFPRPMKEKIWGLLSSSKGEEAVFEKIQYLMEERSKKIQKQVEKWGDV